VAEELVRHREFVNKAKALFNSSIPEIKASVTKFDPDVVAKGLSHHFDSFLKEAKAEIVATKDLTIGDVFDKYDDGERGLAQRGIGVLQRFGRVAYR
jgi:hypothetical protein